jgi:tetratricopeptide (TPR) repeat protein
MLWPVQLVPFYPYPTTILQFADLNYAIPGIIAFSITVGCMWLWKQGRYLLGAVWAYYLITLLPVSGIIQVGIQSAADRYTYLPSIGIFLLAGIGIAQLSSAPILKKNTILLGGLIVVLMFTLFGQLAVKQIAIWRDSETMWRYVINSFPGRVPVAHYNLGLEYYMKGMHDKAIEEYERTIAINPTHVKAHNGLGLVYYMRGMHGKAIEAYEKALAINPTYAQAHNNLGSAYMGEGEYDKAIEAYEKALALNPDFADAHNNLGTAYYKISKYSLAQDHFDKALSLGYKVNPKLLELIKTQQLN